MLPATFISALLSTALTSSVASASPLEHRATDAWTTIKDNVVYKPESNWASPGTLYARTLQLADNSLLVTSEIYSPADQLALPIFRSTDGGISWTNYTQFYDKVNGWGMRYQPFLYTLPQAMGGYAAGTILAAGTSLPKNLSHAYIDLYASTDNAKTFNFVSHIAYGSGPETTRNGDKAVWESFLMMYDGKLICFYSDQRDSKYAQKLVHTTTTDLKNWTPDVEDITKSYYGGRPGMTTVAYSPKSQKYIMTYENCGAPQQNCQVHYRISDSPLTFNDQDDHALVAKTGKTVSSNPYILWVPDPRETDGSGLFLANGNSDDHIYINDDCLDPDNWSRVDIGVRTSYSRSLRLIKTPTGQDKLMVGSGGNFHSLKTNAVRVSVMDIPAPQ